ncbi:MAG: glycosyltransferase [Balneolaceae bacterium]
MALNKMLIVGKVWPEPKSSAAGSRMMQLIEAFQARDYQITFASAASVNDFMADLEDLGIETVLIELNNSSFDTFILKLNPQLVLFDRFMTEEQFGWRVAETCPQALRILDTEDLHCLRAGREQAWKEDREFRDSDLVSDIAKREIASIWRCDLSLIISETEMDLLKIFFKVEADLLLHLPFMLINLKEQEIENWPDFKSREHFISIGNFLHEPNWNAVLYLKEEIWPLIRKELPNSELHIYGAYSSQKVEQLHNPKEGFLVKGRAVDSKEVVGNAKILLAPLRFGAGLKGKLIEAMQCGTPSVTTPIGAESVNGELPWPGTIADDPKGIAESAVNLYRDQQVWECSQKNGIRVINERYSKKELEERLLNAISKLQKNLESHRQNNFTGQMLHHHSMAGTKYMSKWIEAKNRITY